MGSASHVITYRHLITVGYVSQSVPVHHTPKTRLILQSNFFFFWRRFYANKLLLGAPTPGFGQRVPLICKCNVVAVFFPPIALPRLTDERRHNAVPALDLTPLVGKVLQPVTGARQTIAVIIIFRKLTGASGRPSSFTQEKKNAYNLTG